MNEPTQPNLKKKLHETFEPLNDFMIVEKVEIDDKVGGLFIPDPDKWQRRWRVVATSKKLMPHINDYEVGDVLITSTGVATQVIQIDDTNYYFIRKEAILCKIKE